MAQYIKTEDGYKRLEESISAVTDNKMDKTNPTGTGSFSMNRKAGTVVGVNSHAEGYNTTASGGYSHAEGYYTTARENYSHAEGSNTTASMLGSHAEGYHTTASGDYSHAEGNNTIASGDYSHAEGNSTKAHGGGSHAEGYNTTASGSSSHAEGYLTTAIGTNSHVQGKYNIEDTSNTYADIIGNGTSKTARSNAATVDWSGNAWFAGDVYIGSTSGTNKDDGSKKLATEEYVNSSIAADCVLYTAQSLTEEEQAQARANIGAQDLYNGLTPVSYSCSDGTYSVSDTVYLESGNIISPTNTVSSDIRIAFRFINFWGIPTPLDYWKNDIKKYKLLIDNGYLENNTIWYSKPDKKLKKQIRFGTHSTLGNYIIFNFNYDYEVIGQLVYYVDTDTISTGTDTYLNYSLKRDKNNVLSYSAIKLSSDPTEPMQIATKQYVDNAITNIPATDLSNCVQTDKENILGDNGSIISNSSRGNNLTISNGVIEQKNGNQDTVSLGDAKVVFSHDNDGSSSTKGSGTFTMYGRKGEEYFKFKGTNGDVRVSGIATPTLSNDAVNKGYVDLQIANIEIPTVPTNVSAFTNDAGYLTAVPSEYITETELNAKGYLTEHQSLADYALKSEIPSPYSLPTASATALGGIKVGAGLAIADDGTLSMNIASAAVGQIIKVKAIDESGKPTAWEAVNMPSGGEHWEKITEIELTDAASLITINQDATGKPFALKRVMIDCTINIDQDNAMTYVKTLLNNMTVCNNKSINFAASATGYYSFYAELIPGSGALAWQTAATNNYNWGGEILKMGYKYNNIWQSNAITSLTISPNDGGKNFGIAGTKIAVQGVRA